LGERIYGSHDASHLLLTTADGIPDNCSHSIKAICDVYLSGGCKVFIRSSQTTIARSILVEEILDLSQVFFSESDCGVAVHQGLHLVALALNTYDYAKQSVSQLHALIPLVVQHGTADRTPLHTKGLLYLVSSEAMPRNTTSASPSFGFQIKYLQLRIKFLDVLALLHGFLPSRLLGTVPKESAWAGLHLQNTLKLLHVYVAYRYSLHG
jgi:hypothetical protein